MAIPCPRHGSENSDCADRPKHGARGAGWSVLGASYLSYDRDEFIAMLND
jgi:hypothetical protein